ncbi:MULTISPECIES: flavodoxin domain-containing protein [Methanoculleus]|uniref:Flavodoxin n=2 Tax=Methanoculleus TaxID=45989 RepID=A3CWK0_METMJ|nr:MULTISPECIES: flavodoxin domain-containing protein [Methanoculleus]ABN57750.1 flavodoxin [Methanoculleus marisnigri JR1]MCC7556759.1 flavodoxin domain-containing protein [Methanoculleus marisnigri]UYU19141.1 flavodoxin domain-containing protein [Methanoculleus submarinus]
MAERILVAYATRYGSTAEVAEAIGDELRKVGAEVDVRPVDEIRDLSPYRAAVIGSPIYMGKWLPEPQVFIEKNQQRLRTIPVAYFSVGLTVTDRSPEILRKAEASMDAVRMLVNPVEVGIFPGKLESSGLSFTDRTIVKMIRAKTGDFRDWEIVRSWAQAVHRKLTAA